jgi:hypothetical protein
VKGFAETILGTRRVIEDILCDNLPKRKTAERQAVNTVCQGSSADLIKVLRSAVHCCAVQCCAVLCCALLYFPWLYFLWFSFMCFTSPSLILPSHCNTWLSISWFRITVTSRNVIPNLRFSQLIAICPPYLFDLFQLAMINIHHRLTELSTAARRRHLSALSSSHMQQARHSDTLPQVSTVHFITVQYSINQSRIE